MLLRCETLTPASDWSWACADLIDRHRLADPAVPLRDLGECDSIGQ
ncbi:MAG: hypothetical protein ACRDQI_08700 [Pseudonocardiaceae bacterium]